MASGEHSFRLYRVVAPTAGLMTAGTLKELPVLSSSPIDLTLLFSFLCVVQTVKRLGLERQGVPRSAAYAAVLIGLLEVGLIAGPAPGYGVSKAADIFGITAVGCVTTVVVVRTEQVLAHLFRVLAAIGAVVSVVALAQRRAILEHAWTHLGVREGGNSLVLGRAAGLTVVVLAVGYLLDDRAMTRRRTIFGIAPAVAALVLSVAQGPILGAIVAIPVAAWTGPVHRFVRRRLVATVSLVMVAGAIAMRMAGAFRTHALLSFSAGSEGGRIAVGESTIRAIAAHPLGVGLGGFASVVTVPWRTVGGRSYPHNLWLEVAIEQGIAVAVAVGVMSFAALRGAWHARRRTATFAQLFAVLVFLTLNAAVSGDLNDNRLYLMVLTLSLGAASLSSEPAPGVPIAAVPPSAGASGNRSSPPRRRRPTDAWRPWPVTSMPNRFEMIRRRLHLSRDRGSTGAS